MSSGGSHIHHQESAVRRSSSSSSRLALVASTVFAFSGVRHRPVGSPIPATTAAATSRRPGRVRRGRRGRADGELRQRPGGQDRHVLQGDIRPAQRLLQRSAPTPPTPTATPTWRVHRERDTEGLRARSGRHGAPVTEIQTFTPTPAARSRRTAPDTGKLAATPAAFADRRHDPARRELPRAAPSRSSSTRRVRPTRGPSRDQPEQQLRQRLLQELQVTAPEGVRAQDQQRSHRGRHPHAGSRRRR